MPSSPIALADALHALRGAARPDQAGGAELLGLLDQLVDLAARELAAPGMTKPRTVPPCATASRKMPNGDSANSAPKSWISRPKRRSGLSDP